MKDQTYYFIVNPRAGSGKTMRHWVPAERWLLNEGVPFVTAMTDHKRHATALARDAAAKGYRRIIAVGGDGSFHEMVNGLCSWCVETGTSPSEFTVSVIPIGSGNDWIKAMGIPCDVMKALGCLLRGDTAQVDVIRGSLAGGKTCYMANVGGVGFDSHVCRRVNAEKDSGHRSRLIYLNSLVHTVLNMNSIDVQLVADGQTVFTGKCYSIAFGNGPYSGSGMRQVQLARPDDEWLDYLVIPKLPLGRIAVEARRIFTGTMHHCAYTITGRCKKLELIPLSAASNDIVEFDGEIVGRIPLRLEVTGEKINAVRG